MRKSSRSKITRPTTSRNARLGTEALEDRSLLSAALAPSSFEMLATPEGGVALSYGPDLVRTAYGLNNLSFSGVVADGHGQTIAIVDAFNDPNIVGDLNTFDKAFGTTSTGSTLFQKYGNASSFLSVVNQQGQALNPATTALASDSTGNWEREIAMDVEWAHSMAPGAKIVLVEANSDNISDLTAGIRTAAGLPGVSAVSMSWGIGDSDGTTPLADSTFTTPRGHEGVTFLAPAGDNGTTNDPAMSPNVVNVGGTSLNLDASGNITSETAWGSTGGGTSLTEQEPGYQMGVQTTGQRVGPDVAFDANPGTGVAVYDSFDKTQSQTGWWSMGGTSLGTPAWAGLVAIANEGRALKGLSTLDTGNSTQTLSALYSVSANDFNSLTASSTSEGSAAALNTLTGQGIPASLAASSTSEGSTAAFNALTGLGSPAANRLLPDLADYQAGGSVTLRVQPPADVTAGSPFSVSVVMLNKQGKVATHFEGLVTLSLGNNPDGATLGGTLTVKAVNGVATFKNLSISQTGSGFTLKASAGKLAPVMTNAFNVSSWPIATPPIGIGNPVQMTASPMDDSEGAYSNASGGYSTSYGGSYPGSEYGGGLYSSGGQTSFPPYDEYGGGYSTSVGAGVSNQGASSSGWQWQVGGQLAGASGYYGSTGWSFGGTISGGSSGLSVNIPVGDYGQLSYTPSTGQVGVSGSVPFIGPYGIPMYGTGALNFSPNATTIWGGLGVGLPGIAGVSGSVGYTIPYGYQDAYNAVTGYANSLYSTLGSYYDTLNNPSYWQAQSDLLGYGLGSY